MRLKFDEQLDLLNKELITMGAFCENAIAMSAKALTEGNPALAKAVPDLSVQIDHKEREIETMCLKLLLQQQPVAKRFEGCIVRAENGDRYGKNRRSIRRHSGNYHISQYPRHRRHTGYP